PNTAMLLLYDEGLYKKFLEGVTEEEKAPFKGISHEALLTSSDDGLLKKWAEIAKKAYDELPAEEKQKATEGLTGALFRGYIKALDNAYADFATKAQEVKEGLKEARAEAVKVISTFRTHIDHLHEVITNIVEPPAL